MSKWLTFWRAFDMARVVPRICLAAYAWQMYAVQAWFFTLKDPTAAQGAFVSVVYGVAPLLLNFYMQNGVNWKDEVPV